jgi:hypothetical protein
LTCEQILLSWRWSANSFQEKNYYPNPYAINVVSNAEDPYNDFPTARKITFARARWLQKCLDTHVYAGYDSAKLRPNDANYNGAQTREEAISKMKRIEFYIEGIK